VDWKHSDLGLAQLDRSKYYNIWKRFPGGHKKYSYFELYDRLFANLAGKKPKVLEIGVYKGASIYAWKDFFGEDSRIVGIDIDPECKRFEDKSQDIYVLIGNQSDTQFLRSLTNKFGVFDVIIDDGSHVSHDTIATFNYAFPNWFFWEFRGILNGRLERCGNAGHRTL
jgi:hypothetical protein